MKKLAIVLLLTFFSFVAYCQELTLYVIPPKANINWGSPQSLFLSYAGSMLAGNHRHTESHAMGHVIIELKDSSHHIIAGMEAKSKPDMAAMVYKGGYGLGVFFAGIPGKLVEGQENSNDIAERYSDGAVAFIKFKLSAAAFLKLWQYLEEYKEYGYDNIYNGENKPREGKGAGCSAFGVSFIEIAGLLPTNEVAKWLVSVPIPQKLVGGPGNNDRKVGLHKLLLTGKWADTSRHDYRTAAYHEPNLMYKWILAAWETHHTTLSYNKEERGMAKGIVFDCTKYPVPNEPIWPSQQQAPVIAGFIPHYMIQTSFH